MPIDITDLNGWAGWLILAGAAALALRNLGNLARWLRLDRLTVRLLAAAVAPAAEALDARIREVLAEVRPNGGASLRDAVDETNALMRDHIVLSATDRSDLREQLSETQDELHQLTDEFRAHVAYAERKRPEPGDTYDDPPT